MLQAFWQRLKEHPLLRSGPGLITGVADDDPSGLATYSQAGVQFGLNILWTTQLAPPLMAAIQSMCARLGRVTAKGLSASIKAAMGELAELVTGFNRHLMTAILFLPRCCFKYLFLITVTFSS